VRVVLSATAAAAAAQLGFGRSGAAVREVYHTPHHTSPTTATDAAHARSLLTDTELKQVYVVGPSYNSICSITHQRAAAPQPAQRYHEHRLTTVLIRKKVHDDEHGAVRAPVKRTESPNTALLQLISRLCSQLRHRALRRKPTADAAVNPGNVMAVAERGIMDAEGQERRQGKAEGSRGFDDVIYARPLSSGGDQFLIARLSKRLRLLNLAFGSSSP